MFLGMSKYEGTSYLCTLFDIQCCQSVIRKLVYGFMRRLDSSVNCIIMGILSISLRYTPVYPGYVITGVVYYISLRNICLVNIMILAASQIATYVADPHNF